MAIAGRNILEAFTASISAMSVVVGYVPDATGVLAVEEGARQAAWRDTELVIVNVVGAAGFAIPTAADEKTLDAVSERLNRAGVQFSIRQVEQSADRPSDVLLAVAAETGAEVLVVGLRRTSPVVKAVLGSTVQRVLAEASCPVLCVRAVEDDQRG
jgi:nucleotide-binding universal stress UspA family protein